MRILLMDKEWAYKRTHSFKNLKDTLQRKMPNLT
jgi:hypothetical protein